MPPKKKSPPLTEEDLKLIDPHELIPKEFFPEPDNPHYDLHQIKLPFRMCVTAPSGTGKTSFIFNLIRMFGAGEGTFRTIHIVCASADEPIYNFIKEKCPEIKITEGIQSIPKLNKENFDKIENHWLILDDLVLEKKQDLICTFFQRCRKFNISVSYLSQKFHATPIWIRANSDIQVILGLDNDRDTKLVLKEFSVGVSKEQLWNMYVYATNTRGSPLFINVPCRDMSKKFRKGISEYLDPSKFT
jgi:hypothetical protein